MQNNKTTKAQKPKPLCAQNEGQAQMEKFQYNPIALGKPIKSKQVVAMIQQPWYQQLMTSGTFQV